MSEDANINVSPTFYMVWNPGNRNPLVQHRTRTLAETEAERLAEANPGQQFFVLKAMSVSEVKNVITRRFV